VATIIESQDLLPLNGGYLKAKEWLVLTEQQVLCMIRYGAMVCHPHWCVLVIMEMLGFGRGRGDATRGGDATIAMATMTVPMMTIMTMMMEGEGGGSREEGQCYRNNQRWLLHHDHSEVLYLGRSGY
jgi:hypothetical protein